MTTSEGRETSKMFVVSREGVLDLAKLGATPSL